MTDAPPTSIPPTGADGPPRRRRVRPRTVLLAFLALAILAGVFHRPILVAFAYGFRVDDPAPGGAIVMLLGGSSHRPEKAAELYRAGMAPVILLCTEKRDPIWPAGLEPSDLMKQYMVRRGVPESAVEILPGEIGSTREEAARVGEYLGRHPDVRRITVVTTAFHTRRARRVFRRVLGGRGVDVRSAAATDPAFDETNWYLTEDGLILYLNESVKTVYYWLKY